MELKEKRDRVCINALETVINKHQIEDYISIFEPYDDTVCITSENDLWYVFDETNGKAVNKKEFISSAETCFEVIGRIFGENERKAVIDEFVGLIIPDEENKKS